MRGWVEGGDGRAWSLRGGGGRAVGGRSYQNKPTGTKRQYDDSNLLLLKSSDTVAPCYAVSLAWCRTQVRTPPILQAVKVEELHTHTHTYCSRELKRKKEEEVTYKWKGWEEKDERKG